MGRHVFGVSNVRTWARAASGVGTESLVDDRVRIRVRVRLGLRLRICWG